MSGSAAQRPPKLNFKVNVVMTSEGMYERVKWMGPKYSSSQQVGFNAVQPTPRPSPMLPVMPSLPGHGMMAPRMIAMPPTLMPPMPTMAPMVRPDMMMGYYPSPVMMGMGAPYQSYFHPSMGRVLPPPHATQFGYSAAHPPPRPVVEPPPAAPVGCSAAESPAPPAAEPPPAQAHIAFGATQAESGRSTPPLVWENFEDPGILPVTTESDIATIAPNQASHTAEIPEAPPLAALDHQQHHPHALQTERRPPQHSTTPMEGDADVGAVAGASAPWQGATTQDLPEIEECHRDVQTRGSSCASAGACAGAGAGAGASAGASASAGSVASEEPLKEPAEGAYDEAEQLKMWPDLALSPFGVRRYRRVWTHERTVLFQATVQFLGLHATPTAILDHMIDLEEEGALGMIGGRSCTEGLTKKQIKCKLNKVRLLKKLRDDEGGAEAGDEAVRSALAPTFGGAVVRRTAVASEAEATAAGGSLKRVAPDAWHGGGGGSSSSPGCSSFVSGHAAYWTERGPAAVRDDPVGRVERLRQVLTCSICLDLFEDPHSLSTCQHSFCYACIRQFFRQRGESCPRCRHPARWRDVTRNHELAEIVGAFQPEADEAESGEEEGEEEGEEGVDADAARCARRRR